MVYSHSVTSLGGEVWHDACVDCCLKLAALIGLSPLAFVLSLNPFPPQAAVPIGLTPPRALDLPVGPVLFSLHTLPVPWLVVPTKPPDCPCATALCQVHTEEGSGPCHWPGASRQTPHTGGGGPLPMRGAPEQNMRESSGSSVCGRRGGGQNTFKSQSGATPGQ